MTPLLNSSLENIVPINTNHLIFFLNESCFKIKIYLNVFKFIVCILCVCVYIYIYLIAHCLPPVNADGVALGGVRGEVRVDSSSKEYAGSASTGK